MVSGAIRHSISSLGLSANWPNVKTIRQRIYKVREQHAKGRKHDYSHVFKSKSRFDLIRLSCIVLGIEFAYAAETAFASPILLQIGIERKFMTLVWGLSPFIGIFLAPLMGFWSDQCRLSWGRRRPFILVLAIGISAGLIMLPWGENISLTLSNYFDEIHPTEFHFQNHSDILNSETILVSHQSSFHILLTFIIIIGTVLLDLCADTCQSPSRAYLVDVCTSDDHSKALSTFTIMAGFGGFMGYTLGGINWEMTEFGMFLGGNVKTVFSIVTIIFLLSALITLTSFREVPLPLMEQDELLCPVSQSDIDNECSRNNSHSINGEEIFVIKQNDTPHECSPQPEKYTYHGLEENYTLENTGKYNSINIGGYDNHTVTAFNGNQSAVTFSTLLKTIFKMPKYMRILSVTNLLSWMAHISYCLYFTDFVGEVVFKGNPIASLGSNEYELYHDGIRFGCWGLAIYALSCAIYSILVERLLMIFRSKIIYMGGLITYGCGMMILGFCPNKMAVLLISITAGILYATIFTMPYLLIAKYHTNNFYNKSTKKSITTERSSLTCSRGLGIDLAIIGSAMFMAQIIVSLCMGPLIHFVGSISVTLHAASIFALCAAISANWIQYSEN